MHTLSTNENDRDERLDQARMRDCLIAQTMVPLAVVVLGIKIGKLLFVYFDLNDTRTALGFIYSPWLVCIAVAAVVALMVGIIVFPRRKWLLVVSPFIVLILAVLAKLVQAMLTGEPVVAYYRRAAHWLVLAAMQLRLILFLVVSVVRMDVMFLAFFGIFVYVAVTLTPATYQRLVRTLLAICTSCLLLISGLELAHYAKTGVTGTGRLLGFFLTNAANLLPMLRAQIDIVSIAALVGPLFVGWAIAFLFRRWYAAPERGSVPRLTKAFAVALALPVAAAFIHPLPRNHTFDRFVDNTYLGLRDLIPWRKAGELEAMKRASGLPILSDTSHTVLSARADAVARPRNVIIIMLESARAGSTSIYDPPKSTTPFLADFAKQGAVVPEMYAIIPRTSAAWVAVLHGIWPSPEDEITRWARKGQLGLKSLPAMLATRGYASAFFTSAHLTFGYDAPLIKNMRFDSVNYADTLPKRGFEQPTYWGFEDRIMVEPALDWVKQQRDKQTPFLLVMMTNIGHYDYRYPSTWQGRSFGTFEPSYNSYLNCLTYVDSVINEFVTGLEKLGALHSSLVIILGDHGESFGEHGPRGRSLLVYEETVKIPGIVYADGLVPPGTSISGLRQEIDVLPTVLDALGLTAEGATLPGTSLLRPVPDDRALYFFATLDSYSMAMRRGRMKFIYNFERTPTEAYAIDIDPGEQHDIAATLPHQTIEDAVMEMLVWRERTLRPFVAPDTNVTVH
jgi:lipoteichoic acid synthase